MAAIFSLRNFVKKQLLKSNEQGIMTLPDKGQIDFGEMIIRENLFKKGIDVNSVTSEKQLESILNTPIPTPPPQKSADVLDLTGKKIDTDKPIVGGKNIDWEAVEKTDIEDFAQGGRTGLSYLLAEDTNERVPLADGKQPFYGEIIDPDWDEDNPEHMKLIRKLLLAGEIPQYAGGSRVPFKLGGIDKMRRGFLKMMGAGAAGIGAAKTGLFGLLKGGGKQAAKDLAQVPIGDPAGMPPWFKPLVNRVIKEGDDMTKQFATKEREIVHATKIGDDDYVRVTQDLDSGNVRVEYEGTNTMGEQSVQLEYKASQEIPLKGGKTSVKTTEEFSAVEAEPRVMNPDGDIEWDGENVVSEVKDLMSDTSKLKQFGTGKPLSKKELAIAKQKQEKIKNMNENQGAQGDFIEEKYGPAPDDVPDHIPSGYDKMKSGGRVPFVGGGWAFKLAKKYRQSKEYKKFIEKLFLKTSTDIRRGEGAFKNLSIDKKIQLHDDLTKEATNYQKTGELPESAHQYFGFNPEQQYADRLLQKQLKMTPEEELRQEFPGITDDLLNQILTDTNQQRIAEVKATMKEALKMQEKGMGTEEIIQVIQKTPRTKNALGGLAHMVGE